MDQEPAGPGSEEPWESLLRGLRSGDREAFVRVVERVQARVFRFCYRICGRSTSAQEFAQDVFLKLYQQPRDFATEAKLLAWLFTVARNLIIDDARSPEGQLRSKAIDEPGEREELSFLHAGATDAEVDRILGVRAALSSMKEEDRSLFVLIDLEGYTVAEAAEVLGFSERAAKSRIVNARKRFAAAYDAQSGTEEAG